MDVAGDSDRRIALAEALFEALPVAALIHGDERFVAANAEGRRMLDAMTPDELEGLALSKIVHPDSRDASQLRRQYMSEHGRRLFGIPVKLVSLRGTTVGRTVAASSFTCDGDTLIVATECAAVSDPCPSERRRDLPVAPDGSPVAAALDALPLPVVAISDFHVAYVNHSACEVLKAAGPQELEGRPVTQVIHPDFRTGLFNLFRLAQGRSEYRSERDATALALDGTAVHAKGKGAFTSHDGKRYGMWVVTAVQPEA